MLFNMHFMSPAIRLSKHLRLVGLPMMLVLTFLLSGVKAEDWLQWRGPNRTARSAETGLLQQWSDGGPEKLWQYDQAGLGYAGFAVANQRLYTMGLEGDDEFALCLNTETGQEIWRQNIGKRFKNGWGDGPRSTPTLDGDRAYFLTARGNLACLNASDGEKLWGTEMQSFGGNIPFWGYSESPLVDGDKVFCTPGGKQGAVIALDKLTGEKIWQCEEFTDQAHYSSIIVADHNGSRQVIQLLPSHAIGLDSENGNVLWQYEWGGKTAVIPTPIFADGTVYITSGYGAGSAGLKIGDDNQVEELFRNKVMKNHHGGVVDVNGHVYGYSDAVGFVCQKLSDGEMVWNDKRVADKGAVTYADNRFYFVQEKDGQIFLLEANPDGLTTKGSFKLEPQSSRRSPQGRIWVHPVISSGRMYLRDQEYIYCFDLQS